jgi:sulfite reductase (ferredoxin)
LSAAAQEARHYDNGRGIITGSKEEPLYGRTFLPKKFKIAVTAPGDNSVDIYINDIGLVVILEADGRTLKGYNVLVGGGMGRSNNKESTFARVSRPAKSPLPPSLT